MITKVLDREVQLLTDAAEKRRLALVRKRQKVKTKYPLLLSCANIAYDNRPDFFRLLFTQFNENEITLIPDTSNRAAFFRVKSKDIAMLIYLKHSCIILNE